jgi:hypothetical protein
MFTEINGLPVHPLAVHGAVVLVPLAALMGVLFAIPRTRAWSRWPLLLVSLGAVVAVLVARQSGLKLKEHLAARGHLADLVSTHQSRAKWLIILVILFAIVAIAAFVLTRSADTSQAIITTLSVVLVIGAVAMLNRELREDGWFGPPRTNLLPAIRRSGRGVQDRRVRAWRVSTGRIPALV